MTIDMAKSMFCRSVQFFFPDFQPLIYNLGRCRVASSYVSFWRHHHHHAAGGEHGGWSTSAAVGRSTRWRVALLRQRWEDKRHEEVKLHLRSQTKLDPRMLLDASPAAWDLETHNLPIEPLFVTTDFLVYYRQAIGHANLFYKQWPQFLSFLPHYLWFDIEDEDLNLGYG